MSHVIIAKVLMSSIRNSCRHKHTHTIYIFIYIYIYIYTNTQTNICTELRRKPLCTFSATVKRDHNVLQSIFPAGRCMLELVQYRLGSKKHGSLSSKTFFVYYFSTVIYRFTIGKHKYFQYSTAKVII